MSEPQESLPFDGIRESHKQPPIYFTVLFYGLIVWGLLFSAYYLFSGWSSQGEFRERQNAYEQQHGLTRN